MFSSKELGTALMKHWASLTLRLLQWSLAVLLSTTGMQVSANSQDDFRSNVSGYRYLKELPPIPLDAWKESSFDLYNQIPGAFSSNSVLTFESCGASCLRVGLYSPENQCMENCYIYHANRLIGDGDFLYADNVNINNDCKISVVDIQGKKLSEHRCLDTPELSDGTSLYFSISGDHHLVVGTYNATTPLANSSVEFWSVNTDDNTHRVLKLPSHDIYQTDSSVYLKNNGLWLQYETALHNFYLCFYPMINKDEGQEWEPVCSLLPENSENGAYQLYPVMINGQSRVLARTGNGMGLLDQEQQTSPNGVAWSWLRPNVSSAYSSSYYSIPALPPLVRGGSVYLAGNSFTIDEAEQPTPFVTRYNVETGEKEAELFIPLDSEYLCNRIVGQPVLNDSGEYLYAVMSSRRCACGDTRPCNEKDRRKKKSERLVLNPVTLELLDRHKLNIHVEPITDIMAVNSGFYVNNDGSEVLFEPVSCTREDNPDNKALQYTRSKIKDNAKIKDNDQNYLMLALEVKPASVSPTPCSSTPGSDCHQTVKIIPVKASAIPIPTSKPAYLPLMPHDSDGFKSYLMKKINRLVPYNVGLSEFGVFTGVVITYLIYHKYFRASDPEIQPLLPK